MSGAAVYRIFDIGGTLLYVGSSVIPEVRYRYHAAHAPWWPFKSDVRETWFRTTREARVAERDAIATEHPRWNVAGRSPGHPDGPVLSRFATSHLREEVAIWREYRAAERELLKAQDAMRLIEDRIARIAADRSPYSQEESAA